MFRTRSGLSSLIYIAYDFASQPTLKNIVYNTESYKIYKVIKVDKFSRNVIFATLSL